MNSSTLGEPSAIPELPTHGAHRPLDESVLQSAEEAVVGSHTASPHPVQTYSEDGFPRHSQPGFFVRCESKLSQYVAAEPAKSALVACVTGAIVAALAGRGLSKLRARL